MAVVFDQASRDDIDELIRMRLAYMKDDFGSVSDDEEAGMRKQLPDYFNRKLGNDLIVFVARDDKRIVSVAYLLIVDMPANSILSKWIIRRCIKCLY